MNVNVQSKKTKKRHKDAGKSYRDENIAENYEMLNKTFIKSVR